MGGGDEMREREKKKIQQHHLQVALHKAVLLVPSHHVVADNQLLGGRISHGPTAIPSQWDDGNAEIIRFRAPGESGLEGV